MDPYTVLANHYAKSTLPGLAHSALPNAPQQPYVERRPLFRAIIAALRRRDPIASRRRESPAAPRRAGTLRGVNPGG